MHLCLHKQIIEEVPYCLVPLREEDIFLIMEWRNQQIAVLRQKEPLTREGQKNYYHKVVVPTFSVQQPRQILFSFLRDGKCVGYGGLVHIDWEARRGEMSYLADTDRATQPEVYEEDFSHYIRLLQRVAFEDLSFHRICGETFDIRDHHVTIMERNGFVREGRLRDHVVINGQYIDSIMHGCLKKDYTS